MTDATRIPADWRAALGGELDQPYAAELAAFVAAERAAGPVWPAREDTFRALHATPLDRVRVVIVGQDPYHTPGVAHGLAFSVRDGSKPAPSLRNMFKEIASSLAVEVPVSGELTGWAAQGVLLLNRVLTVREGAANSHRNQGWERLTAALLDAVNQRRDAVVFLAWGKPALKACAGVDRDRHTVLEAPHPSPLSAHRGFLGCGHFTHANRILTDRGEPPIDWQRTGPSPR